jgi:hypothetical protein
MKLMRFMCRLYFRLFPTYRRLEIGCFTYLEADRRIKASVGLPEAQQWVIAPEEDQSRSIGWVYLERRERIWQ